VINLIKLFLNNYLQSKKTKWQRQKYFWRLWEI